MSQFQVLFSGQLADGAAQDAVMLNLSRSLGLDERKVGQLFSGRTVVVKSQLSQDEAYALQEQFSEMGAVARVKDLEPANNAAFRVDKQENDHTLRDITAAHQECPRCSHMQLESQFCARCGVDIASHAKRSRKEDLLIAKKIRDMQMKKQSEANVAKESNGSANISVVPASKAVTKTPEDVDIVFQTAADSRMSSERSGFGRLGSWINRLAGR
ncbi:MAG: hypothetical protein KUG75_03530 [Pseudomonadales bacterium]|nr:hypothetical protein [Pseudomonadales bacterium]